MSEQNPYRAPQTALAAADVKLNWETLVPWDEAGRQALQAVAKHHRWMMRLYLVFLISGGGYLIAKELAGYKGPLLLPQPIVAPVLFFALIYHVYQLAKRVNQSVTPLIALLVMFFVPWSLVVPIYYHRRAVNCFTHFGIRLGLWGISAAKLDTQITANYDAYLTKERSSFDYAATP